MPLNGTNWTFGTNGTLGTDRTDGTDGTLGTEESFDLISNAFGIGDLEAEAVDGVYSGRMIG